MEIVDARQAFYQRNKNCLQGWLRQLPVARSQAIQLLALIFHTNSRLLPGYNGPEVPHGIYDYTPEKTTIGHARKLNARFHVEETAILKNAPIEAIYFQHSVLHEVDSLWLVHAPTMSDLQRTLLDEKLYRVNAWLRSRDLVVQTHLVTAATLVQDGMDRGGNGFKESPGLFLDGFYTESFLLAGKYPVWWLIPPELELHHADFIDKMKVARFVSEQEYIDLGDLKSTTQLELMKQAMGCVHDVQQSPQTSWPKLLVLNIMQKYLPMHDGLAVRLKQHVYHDDMRKEATAENILREILLESIDDLKAADHLVPVDKLLALLQQYFASSKILTSLVESAMETTLHLKPPAFDAMRYIQASRALMREIGLVFEKIVSRYKQHAEHDEAQEQLSLAKNMRLFLSVPAQRIPIMITRPNADLLQGRVIFRHLLQPKDSWQLCVTAADDQEKILYEAEGLLVLIAWSWLNHVVDKSTQVSVECPLRSVKQIDARYALEILVAQLDRSRIVDTSREAFIRSREMQKALVFIHVMLDESLRLQLDTLADDSANEALKKTLKLESLIGHCEQLVVSNWGDVQVQRFNGEAGMLHCLCDWLACGLVLPRPQALPLQAFGYAAGASTYLAQRTLQIYEEMASFFFKKRSTPARFIVRLGQHYYCVQLQDTIFFVDFLGDEVACLQFLELPNPQYIETGIERMSMAVMPLRDIYVRNKPSVVQLYYRVSERYCDTWLLDENGSLCHFKQEWYERDGYLMHWLYLLRNIRKRMKNISYQQRELPVLELTQISNNRLGVLEFARVTTDGMNTQRNFIEVQIQVEVVQKSDRLTMICDGKKFDYKTYTNAVLTEALRYVNSRRSHENQKPVYVTDVDVPLRLFNVELRENIQTQHFLKYVRNFESKIIQLLEV